MILRDEGWTDAETNADVFRRLGEHDVLDGETARRMAMAAGFRNVLSHRYGDGIDDEDVYNFLQHDLPLFREYLGQVRDFLADEN